MVENDGCLGSDFLTTHYVTMCAMVGLTGMARLVIHFMLHGESYIMRLNKSSRTGIQTQRQDLKEKKTMQMDFYIIPKRSKRYMEKGNHSFHDF